MARFDQPARDGRANPPITSRDDCYFRAHVPASCVVPVC